MSVEVRSEYSSGKLLFDWNPDENTIDIVQKGIQYKIKLSPASGTYRIIDKQLRRKTIHDTATNDVYKVF